MRDASRRFTSTMSGPRLSWPLRVASVVVFGLALLFAFEVRADDRPVKLSVLVVEADRTKEGFDARIAENVRVHLQRAGFTGASVIDALDATAEAKGARVQLQIPVSKDRSRNLQVTVLQADAKRIRLRVAIPEFKFDVVTNHDPGGTVAVAFPEAKKGHLFLAVTPRF